MESIESKIKKLQKLFTVDFTTIEKEPSRIIYEDKENNIIVRSYEFGYRECGLFSRCYIEFENEKPLNLIFEGPIPDSYSADARMSFLKKLESIFENKKISDGEKFDIYEPEKNIFYEYRYCNDIIQYYVADGYLLRFYFCNYKNYIGKIEKSDISKNITNIDEQGSYVEWKKQLEEKKKQFEDYIRNSPYYQNLAKEYGFKLG